MSGAPSVNDRAKRVRIFTVHGTFDHEASWDNWDQNDDPSKPSNERHFVNRLSDELAKVNVDFKQADHTEFNWSGGNSHDERRTAAIGLKKRIEHELSGVKAEHGKDYSDYYDGGVFVIGHSHGGTISRLAMNMWDMGDDYYDPQATDHDLKHNDKCHICMQARNGEVAPNTIARPDGVITFGSPFVHFKERKTGLLAARIMAWVFAFLAFVVLALYYASRGVLGLAKEIPPYGSGFPMVDRALQDPTATTALHWVLPILLFGLFAYYIPKRILARLEGFVGKSNGVLFLTASTFWVLRMIAGIALAIYYGLLLFYGWDTATSSFVFLKQPEFYERLWSWLPLVLFWFVALSLPAMLLRWMRSKVEHLRQELPKKYDPDEPESVPMYLSYHTPGDEAGFHLRIFGILTWIVQTLWLTASVTVAVGLVSAMVVGFIELLNGLTVTSIEWGDLRLLFDALTFLPNLLWNGLLSAITGVEMTNLGALPADQIKPVAAHIPQALALFVTTSLIALLPTMLLVISVAYLLSMWLRGSGLVFGSEKFAWTLANKISANRRPSNNAKMRGIVIAPEAWWNMEMAHCFFYKSDRVIKDVAEHIANWNKAVRPDTHVPLGAIFGYTMRWLIVIFAVLGIFAASVHFAKFIHDNPNYYKEDAGAQSQSPATAPTQP